PAAAAAGWTSVSVPQTGNNTELNGMSARTSTDAWAVGVQFGAARQAPPPPVAYHWNGSAWSLTATPSLGVKAGLNAVSATGASLNAITAVSASDIWAVGSFYTTSATISAFALHYNGSSWAVTVLPQPAVTGPSSPILRGVTAVASNNVWAVGENEEVPGLG